MQLGLLDVTKAIRENFGGTIDFTRNLKGKESLDSCIVNSLLELVEDNKITTTKELESSVAIIKDNFKEIKEKYNQHKIINENFKMIKEYITGAN